MHWILQNNIFNEDAYTVLEETLQRFGVPYSVHKVVPFVGDLLPEPELTTNNVICMGSYSMRHWALDNEQMSSLIADIVLECSRVAKLETGSNKVCDAIERHFGIE